MQSTTKNYFIVSSKIQIKLTSSDPLNYGSIVEQSSEQGSACLEITSWWWKSKANFSVLGNTNPSLAMAKLKL